MRVPPPCTMIPTRSGRFDCSSSTLLSDVFLASETMRLMLDRNPSDFLGVSSSSGAGAASSAPFAKMGEIQKENSNNSMMKKAVVISHMCLEAKCGLIREARQTPSLKIRFFVPLGERESPAASAQPRTPFHALDLQATSAQSDIPALTLAKHMCLRNRG